MATCLRLFKSPGLGSRIVSRCFFALIVLGMFIVQSFLGKPLVSAQSTCNGGLESASVTLTPSSVPVLTHVPESQNIEDWIPDSGDMAWILICQQNEEAYT